jgi:DNA replication protein DnaC
MTSSASISSKSSKSATGRKSTLITVQLPVAQWHNMIGEPTIVDAILDRIIHNAHRIAPEDDSMRRKKAARPLTDVENSETNTN